MPSRQQATPSPASSAPDQADEKSPGLFGGLAAWGNDALQSTLGFLKNPKEAIYDARLDLDGRQEEVLGDGHDIGNVDIVLEQLAHAGAYGLLDRKKLGLWGYREAGVADDPATGFGAVLYVPDEDIPDEQRQVLAAIHGGEVKPVLAFRGSETKADVEDTANREGIGSYQFSANAAKIRGMMGVAGGKCILTGHSLGGALAQYAAARFPGGTARVVTFQSPGIPAEEADKVKEHNAAASPEDQIASTHHRAEGDVVHMAGDALTEGDVYTHESVGVGHALDHLDFPLARLAAARGNLVPGVNDDPDQASGDRLVNIEKTTTGDEKSETSAKFASSVHKLFGGLLRDEKDEAYVRLWKDIEKMCESGAFSLDYVLGCVADANLTPDQRIQMRDQVTGLFGDG